MYNGKCGLTFQIFTWIITVITIMLFVSTIYWMVRYIMAEKNKPTKLKSPKCLRISYMSFFIVSSISLLIWPLFIIDPCYKIFDDIKWTVIFGMIGTIFYFVLQIYLLWLVMFVQVYYVFKETQYSLSKCTKIFFIVLFIFLPFIMFIAFFIALGFSGGSGVIIFALYATFSSMLSYLFVYKLIKIHKDTTQFNKRSNGLMATITRTVLLAFISFLFSYISPIVTFSISNTDDNLYLDEFITAIVMLIDMYTNFICVILTYGKFTTQYMKCCGYCDKQCKICLSKRLSTHDTYNETEEKTVTTTNRTDAEEKTVTTTIRRPTETNQTDTKTNHTLQYHPEDSQL